MDSAERVAANGYVPYPLIHVWRWIMRVQYGDAQIIGEQIFFYPKKSAACRTTRNDESKSRAV